jgi:hypothetical protein
MKNPKRDQRKSYKRGDLRSIYSVDLEGKLRRKETGVEEFIGERKGTVKK